MVQAIACCCCCCWLAAWPEQKRTSKHKGYIRVNCITKKSVCKGDRGFFFLFREAMALSVSNRERRVTEPIANQPLVEYEEGDDRVPLLPLAEARQQAFEAGTQRRRNGGINNVTQVNLQVAGSDATTTQNKTSVADKCYFNGCDIPKSEDVEFLDPAYKDETKIVCSHTWFHISCVEKVMRERMITSYRVRCTQCKESHKHKLPQLSLWDLCSCCCCCCCCLPRWLFSLETIKTIIWVLVIMCLFGFVTKVMMFYGASVPELRSKLANRTDSSDFSLFSYRYDCPINEDGTRVQKMARFRDASHFSMMGNVRYSYFANINLCHMILGASNPIFGISLIIFILAKCFSERIERLRFKLMYRFKTK